MKAHDNVFGWNTSNRITESYVTVRTASKHHKLHIPSHGDEREILQIHTLSLHTYAYTEQQQQSIHNPTYTHSHT